MAWPNDISLLDFLVRAPVGMGKGTLAPTWKCCKVFCALVTEFIYALFSKHVVSLGFRPWTPLGDFRTPNPLSFAPPRDKFLATPLLDGRTRPIGC